MEPSYCNHCDGAGCEECSRTGLQEFAPAVLRSEMETIRDQMWEGTKGRLVEMLVEPPLAVLPVGFDPEAPGRVFPG